MESQGQTMINDIGGFEGLESTNVDDHEKEVTRVDNNEMRTTRTILLYEFVPRVLAFALTFSAAVILGVNKQTKVVPVKVIDTLPPLSVPVSAKWHYLSAFMYFVVANAIACSYAVLSLVLSLVNGGGGSNSSSGLVITVADVVMTGLLFSANGAAASISLIGYEGNSHVQWRKVCNVFHKFCVQGAAALFISLLGAVAFLLLVVLSVKRLHKN